MATTYYNQIQQLYLAYFNRPADPNGLAYWETAVETNPAGADAGLKAIAASFATQKEYTDAYAGLSNLEIVKKVYQNLFSRTADDSGATYWADLLTAGKIKVENLVVDMANAAKNQDAVTIQNKVAASAAFTAAVNTDAEKAGYTNDAAAAVAKSFLSGVTDNASLAAAIAPANLDTVVAKVVAAGPFSLTTALASYQAADKAVTDFLDAADGKADGTVTVTPDDIDQAVLDAETDIDALVDGPAYVGATAGVKAALLSDQIAANADELAGAQKDVSDANTAINKVAGLAGAIATLASATTASDNADKAVLTANADLQAKLASYNTLHSTKLTVEADGTVAGLIELKDGKLQLVSGVTETKNAGVTALLSSSTTKEAADAAAIKAATVEKSAQDQVNYLDMSTQEKTDLEAIKGLMKNVKVADGALPTLAQITTEQSILDAKAAAVGHTDADVKAAGDFKAAVTTYTGHAATNDLVQDLNDANDAVDAVQDKIDALSDAIDALNEAKADQAQLAGLTATAKVTSDVFTAHDLALPIPAAGANLASAGSDIFVAGKAAATISLFGLLGNDSLYIGKDYVLNTGKLSAGSDAALEAFVSQSGQNTVIQLEQHAFSSHVTDAAHNANEIVTITLVGVTATDVHLNNGIITVGTTTA